MRERSHKSEKVRVTIEVFLMIVKENPIIGSESPYKAKCDSVWAEGASVF